jgi:hypothetical protein
MSIQDRIPSVHPLKATGSALMRCRRVSLIPCF